MMRLPTLLLACCGTGSILIGCGGGLTQEDMRRGAIKRSSGNDSDNEKKTGDSGGEARSGKKTDTQQRTENDDTASTTKERTRKANADFDLPAAAAESLATSSPPDGSQQGEITEESAGQVEGRSAAARDTPAEPLSLVERRQRTIDNLRRIGEAIHKYTQEQGGLFAHALYGSNDQPMLSWRVELLPYLGHQDLYDKFALDESWDGARNKPLLELIPGVYQSPERFDERTNYLIPVGSLTAFNGRHRGLGMRRVEDGLENTVVLLEVDDSAAVPWTRPQDLALDLDAFDSQVGSLRADGFFAVWCDGMVTRVKPERSHSDLKAIFSCDAGDSFASHLVRAMPEAEPAVVQTEPETDSFDRPTPGSDENGATTPPEGGVGDSSSEHIVTGAPAGREERAERMPVPGTTSLARARNLLREIYEDEYNRARTLRGKRELAKRMLRRVPASADDPAGQYVLLDIVIDIATRVQDSTLAIAALEEMLARFEMEALEQLRFEHGVLEQLAKQRNRGRAMNQALLDQANALIETALRVEAFETAESLCRIAGGAARQLEDERQEAWMERQKNRVREARQAYQLIQRAVAKVDEAEDPKTSFDVGRYYCLIRGEWKKGLPLLAQGSQSTYKELAEIELADPADPAVQMELADGWWALSSQEPAHGKALRLHAAHWYLNALKELSQDLMRVKAELRVKEVERRYGSDAVASLEPETPE